jgi:hypothetical protein
LNLQRSSESVFSIELIVCYSNYFVERVFVFPGPNQPTVERSFVYQYEGHMRYYPYSIYPKAKLISETNRLVIKTETGGIVVYDISLKKEVGKIVTSQHFSDLSLVFCND